MAGRKLKFETAEDLQKAIDKYLRKNSENPSVTEMAVELGFESRQSMYDYKEREAFSYTIKRAVSLIEAKHEKKLFENACTGSIFWLKNRGWNAEEEIKQETTNKDLDLDQLSDAELNKLIAIIGKAEGPKS